MHKKPPKISDLKQKKSPKALENTGEIPMKSGNRKFVVFAPKLADFFEKTSQTRLVNGINFPNSLDLFAPRWYNRFSKLNFLEGKL